MINRGPLCTGGVLRCTCITYTFSPSRPPFNTSGEFWIIWILWCTSVKPDITPVLHQCSGRYRMVGLAPLWLRGEGRGYRCWWPARPSGVHLRCSGMLPGGGGHWTMEHTWWDGSRTRGTLSTRVPRGLVRLACHPQPFGIIVYTRITGCRLWDPVTSIHPTETIDTQLPTEWYWQKLTPRTTKIDLKYT